MADDRTKAEVQQYVADMAALESHIEQAMDGQVKHDIDHAGAAAAIKGFHGMVKAHREGMKAHLEMLGGGANPVKSAVATLFGAGAAVIGNVRTNPVSKMLRDDYTAFNHAAIGYSMLHATAHALRDSQTMELADRYLRDYARATQEINHLIADVTVWELKREGFEVDQGVVEHCTEAINRAWRETTPADSAPSMGSAERKAA